MSKFSEAYISRYYDEQPKHSTRKQGQPRARAKRGVKQVEGQMSFVIEDDGELNLRDGSAEQRKAQFKEDALAYYDAFYDMLRHYGKFNTYYCLLQNLDSEHPSQESLRLLNKHYKGNIANVQKALDRARYWLNHSRHKFGQAAERVDLWEVDARYNEAYRDKDRRTKYYAFIGREKGKIERDKTTLLYTPRDFEDNYQRNRTIAAERAEKKAAEKAAKKATVAT